MVLIENIGQKTKIQDFETSQPKNRESETQINIRKQDFETGKKISETLNFPGTIRHLYMYRASVK